MAPMVIFVAVTKIAKTLGETERERERERDGQMINVGSFRSRSTVHTRRIVYHSDVIRLRRLRRER